MAALANSHELVGQKTVQHLGWEIREYITRDNNGVPSDRFNIFRKFGDCEWTAWTADTLSEKRTLTRKQFARTVRA